MSQSISSTAAPSWTWVALGIARRRRHAHDPLRTASRCPDAARVDQRAVAFDDGDDLAAVLLAQELGGVIAHVAQALHDHALAVQPARQAGAGLVLGVAEEFAQRILHAAARRLDPALNAARMGRLAGHAGLGVDVGGVHARILVGDPGHLALARAHVGGGHVLGGVDQVALDQLIGKAAGDLFQLMLVPGAGIDAEPALRPAEGRLDQRAFVGHQRGQRLDLVLIDGCGIADAALDRFHMFGMDRCGSR
jgi:hypothetical protein